MRVKDYELIRCNDGGEVRVWYDGQIDILKESHMTVGFREAKRRQTTPPEALRSGETPRTDALEFTVKQYDSIGRGMQLKVVQAHEARKLERELAEVTVEVIKYREQEADRDQQADERTRSPLARRPIKCPPEDGGWET